MSVIKNEARDKKLGIQRISNLVTSIFTWIFLLGFGWILINCIFRNTNDLIYYNMAKVCTLGVIIFVSLFCIYFFMDKFKSFFVKIISLKYGMKIALFIFIAVTLALQIFIAKSIYYEQGWDAGTLIRSGKSLAVDPSTFDINYYLRFPNNILLVLIFKNIYYFSSFLGFINYEFLLIVLNIICIDISILILLLISKLIISKTATVITCILSTLMYLFCPWIIFPYSDSLSMFFPVAILFIYLKIKKSDKIKKKLFLSFIVGILGVIGYQIKPTAIIIIVAITISNLIFNVKDKKSLKIYIAITAGIAIGFISTKGLYNTLISNISVNGIKLTDNEKLTIPPTHFMMMGLSTRIEEGGKVFYGSFNEEDYNITFNTNTKEEKIQKNLSEIKKRLNRLGIEGYIKFASKKINWMLSDGTFYYGGEGGNNLSEPYDKSYIGKKIQSFYMYNGANYRKLASLEEGAWIIILFLIFFPIFIKNKGAKDENIFIIRLTLTGIILFLLLFEGRSRYLINHLPFFIMLASYGLGKIHYSVKSRVYSRINSDIVVENKLVDLESE